jgi:hypothetical protein
MKLTKTFSCQHGDQQPNLKKNSLNPKTSPMVAISKFRHILVFIDILTQYKKSDTCPV